jgi:hypothetical protein
MNLLSSIITYIRRIIKSPSNADITDELIIDYINRFWIMDMDARLQLFDLKTVYQFQTTPGICYYNMPLYDIQSETPGSPTSPDISFYPVYQGFLAPAKANGINMNFYTQRGQFLDLWPNYVQQLNPAGIGNETAGPYTLNLPFFPAIPGHVDITGIIATGSNTDPIFGTTLNLSVPSTSVYSGVYITATNETGQNITVADSGQFLSGDTNGDLYGLLMATGSAPYSNTALTGGYNTTTNTVNYATGLINVTFPEAIPDGYPISVQCFFIEQGLPRSCLFYNNTLTIYPPPNTQYQIELDAYLSPAAFFNQSQSLPFAYMAEYIARGAARKILSDTGDVDQFNFYEPLFKEQELLVWKRSQRQFTATRSETIYSNVGLGYGASSSGLYGTGST